MALTALQLPGNWLIVAVTAGLAWYGWGPPEERLVGPIALVALLVLAAVAEIAELVLGAAAARKAGGSRRGALMATLGGIAGAIVGTGAIPIPIIGTLIGAAIGAAAGSLLGDRTAGQDWQPALGAARGAAVGRVTASIVKLAAAVVLWLIAATAIAF